MSHDPEITSQKYFSTENYKINRSLDIEEIFQNMADNILSQMDDFQEVGSGWTLAFVINLVVNINKFEPFGAASFMELPDFIKSKHGAVLNIKNTDEKCFLYCLVAAIYGPIHKNEKNTHLPSSYPQI